jgi:hypothetical protein
MTNVMAAMTDTMTMLLTRLFPRDMEMEDESAENTV